MAMTNTYLRRSRFLWSVRLTFRFCLNNDQECYYLNKEGRFLKKYLAEKCRASVKIRVKN